MKKLVIIVTVPVVLETWLKGQAGFLSNYYEVEIITSFSNTIEDIKKFENVSIKVVDLNRKINLFKDLKVLYSLIIHFIKNRPYFVYSLTPKAGLLGMMAAWIVRIPHRLHNVVGLPHLEAKGKRKQILIMTEKLTYWFATKVYCNSKNLKNEMSNKLTSKEVTIIGNGSVNGVDTEYFNDVLTNKEKTNIRETLNIESKDFVITFIGRIVKDKGINELVSNASKLSQKYRNLKLLLIGDYEDDLDPISDNSKILIESNNNIIHVPFQQDIRPELAITNLFVLPSYREGLPNVLLEAGSYSIPLVATNINGCNEIIIDSENGALVNPKDEEHLYAVIEKFIIDTDYYGKIKSKVRKSIIDRYAQGYYLEKLLEEFLTLEKSNR